MQLVAAANMCAINKDLRHSAPAIGTLNHSRFLARIPRNIGLVKRNAFCFQQVLGGAAIAAKRGCIDFNLGPARLQASVAAASVAPDVITSSTSNTDLPCSAPPRLGCGTIACSSAANLLSRETWSLQCVWYIGQARLLRDVLGQQRRLVVPALKKPQPVQRNWHNKCLGRQVWQLANHPARSGFGQVGAVPMFQGRAIRRQSSHCTVRLLSSPGNGTPHFPQVRP